MKTGERILAHQWLEMLQALGTIGKSWLCKRLVLRIPEPLHFRTIFTQRHRVGSLLFAFNAKEGMEQGVHDLQRKYRKWVKCNQGVTSKLLQYN